MDGKNKGKTLNVKPEWCKGCGICVAFCPKSVLVLSRGKVAIEHPDNWIQCGLCEKLCPDYALWISEEGGATRE